MAITIVDRGGADNGTGTISFTFSTVSLSIDDVIVVTIALNSSGSGGSFQVASISQSGGTGTINDLTEVLDSAQTAVGHSVYWGRVTGNGTLSLDVTLNNVYKTALRYVVLRGITNTGSPIGQSHFDNTQASTNTVSESISSGVLSSSALIGFAAQIRVVAVSSEDSNFSETAAVTGSSGGGSPSTKVTAIDQIDLSQSGGSAAWNITTDTTDFMMSGLMEILASTTTTTTNYMFAQANTKIKQTYRNFSQAQARIKNTYYVIAQIQARIKNIYQGYAQSQTRIVQEVSQFVQTQTNIKQTYLIFAQTQSDIKSNYSVFAQSQGSIKVTSISTAQTNTYIKITNNISAQVQAYIYTINSVNAQVQATIKTTAVVVAQANVKIGLAGAEYNFGQAQVLIYIPQIVRPVVDISNDGWIRVVI